MGDAGDRIGRFSIGGSLAALGAFALACVATLNMMQQNPEQSPRERWEQMLERVWASPPFTIATVAGVGLVLAGVYVMARAAFGPGYPATPPEEK